MITEETLNSNTATPAAHTEKALSYECSVNN